MFFGHVGWRCVRRKPGSKRGSRVGANEKNRMNSNQSAAQKTRTPSFTVATVSLLTFHSCSVYCDCVYLTYLVWGWNLCACLDVHLATWNPTHWMPCKLLWTCRIIWIYTNFTTICYFEILPVVNIFQILAVILVTSLWWVVQLLLFKVYLHSIFEQSSEYAH